MSNKLNANILANATTNKSVVIVLLYFSNASVPGLNPCILASLMISLRKRALFQAKSWNLDITLPRAVLANIGLNGASYRNCVALTPFLPISTKNGWLGSFIAPPNLSQALI